jgi:uncharacterized protein (UPF0276 family)
MSTRAIHGIGLGLRVDLAPELLEQRPPEIRWLELHPENYMERGGRYPALLEEAADEWPIVTHGLTMGFGAVEPFDARYMTALKAFLDSVGTPWHSDHLCFAAVDGVYLHDLVPMPFTSEVRDSMARRFREAEDSLERTLAVENVSYYANARESMTDEVTFLVDFLEAADAKLLLDVNNVYVNSRNHRFDPRAYIDKVPRDRVVQLHVAGHFVRDDGQRIDTHAEAVCEDVYDLLDYTLRRLGPMPVLLERDGNFPSFDEVMSEIRRLTAIYERAVGAAP